MDNIKKSFETMLTSIDNIISEIVDWSSPVEISRLKVFRLAEVLKQRK